MIYKGMVLDEIDTCIKNQKNSVFYSLFHSLFYSKIHSKFLFPADPNLERAMNCGRSSTGTRGRHKCSVCLKLGM